MDESQFNWSLPPQEYSSFKYMLWASKQYPGEEVLSFDEAEKRLREIGEKYTLENQREMINDKLALVQKMFSILAYSSLPLLDEAGSIEKNKLTLNLSEYMSLAQIKSLLFEISLGVDIMNSSHKNYGAAIRAIVAASKRVRETGQYTNDICVGLHGTIHMHEL